MGNEGGGMTLYGGWERWTESGYGGSYERHGSMTEIASTRSLFVSVDEI